jgi:tetratricopeptide (TPR) repeat protein
VARFAKIQVLALSSLTFAPFVLSANGGEKPWTEVKSTNFRVLTDGTASDGRRLAREFEQMRAVCALGLPKMRLESGAILTILAPRDDFSMKGLAPARWKPLDSKFAALFRNGWERQYAVVRLDQDLHGKDNLVYREYVLTLLHANFRWLPSWLYQGLSQFYGNTLFEPTKIYVGAASKRVYRLKGATLIKLDDLITEDFWRKSGSDEQQMDLLQSESWALVHYMMFAPEMDHGKKLEKYLTKIDTLEDRKQAFEDVFGNFKDVEDLLSAYIRRFSFASYELDNPPQVNEKDFPSRLMTVAETQAELGTYRLFCHDREESRAAIDSALHEDANLALARETLGFLDFVDGKDEEAKSEFTRAYAADPRRYLSLYYGTMLSTLAKSTADADVLSFRAAMYEALKANPSFAPAFVELARVMARQGNYPNALSLARRAESLEPSRPGYHLFVGRLLHALGRDEEAVQEASFVGERWRGPAQDEALELWNSIPAEKRPSNAFVVPEISPGTRMTQGILVSLNCQEKERGMPLSIQSPDGINAFSGPNSYVIGYSETLWFGKDHFTPCHHLSGLRAIVRYKPDAAKKGLLGEWTELELRVDLPAATIAHPGISKPDPAAQVNPPNPTPKH